MHHALKPSKPILPRIVVAFLLAGASDIASAAAGDTANGQRVFQTCAACHALEPDRNMTGPSLAGLWSRKAGSLASFMRYSHALRSSGIVWDDKTLDAWLTDPQRLVPGNAMTFPGIEDPRTRSDLIAFLRDATRPGARVAQQSTPMGGMGGMNSGAVPNLRQVGADKRVQAIVYCRDTYEIATADGKKRRFWERNLRFKSDSSDAGPAKGAPALVPAGMMGDRADVFFSDPTDIGQFIGKSCPLNSH